MEKRDEIVLYACIAVLVLLVIGYSSQSNLLNKSDLGAVTGRATTADAQTQADIANYFAINMSTNLSSDGIVFDILSLPANDANATANYNNESGGNNETKLYLTVDVDSNVNVDFCIKANDSLWYGSTAYIGLGNYTWSNSTAPSNITRPEFASRTALTNATWLNSTYNVGGGNSSYYRFWLDVPAVQSPGTYVNTINFKGIQVGNNC